MDDEDGEVDAVADWPVAGPASGAVVVAVDAVDAVDAEAVAAPCVCRTCRLGAGLFGLGGSAVALRAATPDMVAVVAVELAAALTAGCA